LLIRGLMESIRALPAVESVGLSAFGVMRGRGIVMTVAAAGAPAVPGDNLNTSVNYVSPEYFSAMGMQLLEDLRIADLTSKPRKIVANHAFANHFFPHTNALGAQVGTSEQGRVAGPEYVIAGIVSNAKYVSQSCTY